VSGAGRSAALFVAAGILLVVAGLGVLVIVHAALAPLAPGSSQRVRAPARRLHAHRDRATARGVLDGWAIGRSLRFRQPPETEPADRVVVPLAEPFPPRLPAGGVPRGWEVREFAGQASVELVRDEPGLALRLRSDGTSFALLRSVSVDLAQTPVLSWSWKVTHLPAGGDVRQQRTDDEAAQVYVIFPRWPSPETRSHVIGYVWDTRAPVGTVLTSPKAPNVKIVVVESGPSRAGAWQRQERNVRDDYVALFGRPPLLVGAMAVMADTDDTRGSSEALLADLAFSRAPS
jgi:hypothetical protein